MLAITGGLVLTMAGEPIPGGTVLADNGKIIQVGPNVEVPAQAEVVDAGGKIVMPGLIDAHCHVGIVEEIYQVEGDDCNEDTDPVTPQLRAIDAINPEDLGFTDALSGGVTTVVTGPGSANIIGGEMVAMKTYGKVVDNMIVRFPVGVKAALGENPKRSYGGNHKMPATRMASAALLRQALVEAREYVQKLERYSQNPEKRPERNLKWEVLVRVLRREVPLRVHAHRADDIMTAVRIAREFGLKLIIEHCTEGHKVAQELAYAGVAAVVGPVITNRAKVELMNRSLSTAGVLYQAGVPFALMTDHPVVPIQYLGISAALAVRGGLPEGEALKALTINAARLLGLEDRLGSLTVGKDADILIMDRSILDARCLVEKVYVYGQLAYAAK